MKTCKKRFRSENIDAYSQKDPKKEDNPNFLIKLYQILENPDYHDIIHWSENGKCFIIQNLHDFTESILPKYYKHNNYSSFVRQLNMYDFHKKRSNQNEHIFQHSLFSRGEKQKLSAIRRKNRKDFHNAVAFIDNNSTSPASNSEQSLVEYFNNDITKKVTKGSLEKAIGYLMHSINENNQKQKNLEEKVEKLGKQNEDFILQNQQMLKEIMSKTEYNKKLETVVYLILEMILQKQPLKSGNELKNLLISPTISTNDVINTIPSYNPLNNPNSKEVTHIIPFNEIIPSKINCTIDKTSNIGNNAKIKADNFKTFIEQYLERTNNKNSIGNKAIESLAIKKGNLPLLSNRSNDDISLSENLISDNIPLSPIRIPSRRASIDTTGSNFICDHFIRNASVRQITSNRETNKTISINKTDDGDMENSINLSINSKNMFDLSEFNQENNNTNLNNISIRSDKRYLEKCFFDEE